MELATLETGAGPTVLLVHGWGGFKEGWGPLPGALADAGFRTVAVDLPGFGDSPAPRRFRHRPAEVADALSGLVRDSGPLAVVAHSMGAFPSLMLARRLPDLVARLALLGPAPLVVAGRVRRIAALPLVGGRLAAAGIRHSRRDRAAVMRSFANVAAHPERMRSDPAAMSVVNAATDRFIAAPALALGRSAHHALRASAPRIAGQVSQPALVIVGALDPVGRPDDAGRLADALPAGRLVVVPDCGHFPFIERPAAVMAELVPHLRGGA